ncbi:MAG TPA: ImmA/IrrE family metallo-endopeptidase, partial [Ktedonobacterales bacterium]|nr:ImmA/IrrE family metallo-endopeptidase [Ktedonobacterales bacterium]
MADETTRIEQTAAALLHWLEQHSGPWQDDRVPVDTLVRAIGLDVARFPTALYPGTLGYLEPGEDLIFLRSGLAESVRRFTLAHELGHALLHRAAGPPAAIAAELRLDPAPAGDPVDAAAGDDAEGMLPEASDPCDNDDLEAPLDPLSLGDEALRPGQTYSARAHRESEANAFAAALLLPPDRLRALFLGDMPSDMPSDMP